MKKKHFTIKFDPNQARDEYGKWTDTGQGEKIKVYRGTGRNYAEGENEGFLWVSTDKSVASNYADLDDDGNLMIDEFEIEKPKKPFKFGYSNPNQYVTAKNVANIWKRELTKLAKAKKITIDEWRKTSNLISDWEKMAGSKVQMLHTLLNKRATAKTSAQIIFNLGYDALEISEGESVTYGLLKNVKNLEYNFILKFDPNQARDRRGRWTDTGAGQKALKDRPCFNEWFKGSKAVNEDGTPKRFFHGTTHEFDEFSKERGHIENDLGIGFYFSNSYDDVLVNYDDINGADLRNRIDYAAERYQEDEGMSETEAIAKATMELAGGESIILKVYLSINNPIIIGGENETYLDYDYDEDSGKESGTIVDFYEAYQYAAAGFYDVDANKVFEGIELYDGISASKLVHAIKNNMALVYATDEAGRLAGNEILRRAFENMGYDGIFDNTVERFGMTGVYDDTQHVIAFKPNQIKSTDASSFCDKTNINKSGDILLNNKILKKNLLKSKKHFTIKYDPQQPRDRRGRWRDAFHNIDIDKAIILHYQYGGSSIDLEGKNRIGQKGAFSVGIFEDKSAKFAGRVITQKQYEDFIEKYKDVFENSEYELIVGTWYDVKADLTWLDISAITDKETALYLAKLHNQKAIFDLFELEEIDTGGTGESIKLFKAPKFMVKSKKKYKGQVDGYIKQMSEKEIKAATAKWAAFNIKRKN